MSNDCLVKVIQVNDYFIAQDNLIETENGSITTTRLNDNSAYLIRCRAKALHSGLLLHFLKTQVSPTFLLTLAPFLPSTLLPAQEDVVFLSDTNQGTVSHEGQVGKQI